MLLANGITFAAPWKLVSYKVMNWFESWDSSKIFYLYIRKSYSTLEMTPNTIKIISLPENY